ncbi:unnamed protein product [Penicillium salamii]|uniref:von Willebrand factor, type A n=1 Tax=Penicillium salamii TaxID=1612424 RepID=A0A9W4JQR3_9EURO|nr:unnamed protein product [Penicillium salamii]
MDAYGHPLQYSSHGGCFYYPHRQYQRVYIPQIALKAHATVLSSVAHTTLSQTFVNSSDKKIEEVSYNFPLYDGVSVVGFDCKIGGRVLHSSVKTKSQANELYEAEVAQDRVAAVMHHTSQNDVFLIRLGNVPAHEKVNVNITFVGELKQDSQTDGIRYTLPSAIAPRYGTQEGAFPTTGSSLHLNNDEEFQAMSVTVDVVMDEHLVITELESPSHRIKVSLGRTSTALAEKAAFDPCQASAAIKPRGGPDEAFLGTDFVLLIKVDGLDQPCALVETHPTISNQRALMATLVPKFGLPTAHKNEIVFVIDRSGSMGNKIPTLISALKVFLKSLPVGVCFNICSFGFDYSFLWPTSKIYDAFSLDQAILFVETIGADMGGTEMEQAVVATVAQRLTQLDLEVLLLTDGEISQQDSLFNFVGGEAIKGDVRFFTLGIGDDVSHSLVEGVARAGNGFCQTVLEHEELDRKVIRMLKGALTPHISDYKLEVKYDGEPDGGFEHVSAENEDLTSETEYAYDGDSIMEEPTCSSQQPISLFDENFEDREMDADANKKATSAELPTLNPPQTIQAPYKIPTLYPFIRTNVYLLMDPQTSRKTPTSVILSATSPQGPLTLRVPVCDIGLGKTIHQLASRKAIMELEQESGWLSDARDNQGNAFKNLHMATQQRLAERECQSLGIKFGITGKYSSFVAVEESTHLGKRGKNKSPREYPVECESESSFNAGRRHNSRNQPSASHHQFISLVPQAPYVAPMKRPNYPFFNSSQNLDPYQMSRTGGVSRAGSRGGGRGAGRGGIDLRIVRDRAATALAAQPVYHQFMQQQLQPSQQQQQFARTAQSQPALAAPIAHSAMSAHADTNSAEAHQIIYQQSYEGSWTMSDKLFELMHCDRKKTTEDVAELYARSFGMVPDDFPCDDQTTIVATLLMMGYLENNHKDKKSSWELVYAKAARWVACKFDETKGTVWGRVLCSIQHQISDLMREESESPSENSYFAFKCR